MSELCAEISGGRGRRTALHSLPFSLSLSIFITLALTISASLPLAFFFGYQLATFSSPLPPLSLSLSLSPFLLGPPTVLRALSMSMPWLHGTAGLARQSPALPRRETSTRWRRRYLKASAITRMASWVRAEVYCTKTPRKNMKRQHTEEEKQKMEKYDSAEVTKGQGDIQTQMYY